MLIRDLPPFLRKRAIRNHYDPKCSRHARYELTFDVDILQECFLDKSFGFLRSPEGLKFWALVNKGKFYHPYVLFKYLITW